MKIKKTSPSPYQESWNDKGEVSRVPPYLYLSITALSLSS